MSGREWGAVLCKGQCSERRDGRRGAEIMVLENVTLPVCFPFAF